MHEQLLNLDYAKKNVKPKDTISSKKYPYTFRVYVLK